MSIRIFLSPSIESFLEAQKQSQLSDHENSNRETTIFSWQFWRAWIFHVKRKLKKSLLGAKGESWIWSGESLVSPGQVGPGRGGLLAPLEQSGVADTRCGQYWPSHKCDWQSRTLTVVLLQNFTEFLHRAMSVLNMAAATLARGFFCKRKLLLPVFSSGAKVVALGPRVLEVFRKISLELI